MNPIDDEFLNVAAQVERIESMKFTDREGVIVPVLQGIPPGDALSWEDLTPEQKAPLLGNFVNWEGFTWEQELRAIDAIVAGEVPLRWMEAIAPEPPTIDPLPTPEEFRALREEWAAEYALRAMPESERDAQAERSTADVGIAFESDEPTGFQVWHKEGEGFRHVADADSNALGAIMMTTHGFGGLDRWQDRPGLAAQPGDHRSTDIGDVLIGPDGKSLEIAADRQYGLTLIPVESVSMPDRSTSPVMEVMEAVGNSPLPDSIRQMESEYRRMLEQSAGNGIRKDKDIER